MDETADISHREQLCITVRTVTEDLEAEEMMLRLYALDSAQAIYNITAFWTFSCDFTLTLYGRAMMEQQL